MLEALFVERQLHTEHDRTRFLQPDFDRDTHDPFLLVSMRDAVARVLHALEQKEHVAVYADFDCDGIPGAVVLHDFFKKVGHDRVSVYIPHRDKEGYGLHLHALDSLKEKGVSLVITVDVGTVAHEAASYAASIGLDLIITDHHEPQSVLPDAIAVINPKRAPYPFPHLCGAAVAFKVVQAVMSEGRTQGLPAFTGVPHGWEKWLLDMVGIATVADMVPLSGENRVFASFGLMVLRKSPRPGIHALCRQNRVDQRTLTEQDIGFTIGPRINAASRMDSPELAFELLSTTNMATAEALAAELEKLNRKRKGVVASMVKEARAKVTDRFPNTSVALVGDPTWKPSLLGLAANSVLSGRKGMVCLWGRDATGVIKGSCRSDGTVNVVSVFEATSVLLEAGGHACAGGFSVAHEHIHTLPELFQEMANGVEGGDIGPTPRVFDVPLNEVARYHNALEQFAPFGIGNERPLVRVISTALQVKTFGKEGTHTELRLTDGTSTVRAFEFFKTPLDFTREPHEGVECAVVGSLVLDGYGMRKGVGIRIHDIH